MVLYWGEFILLQFGKHLFSVLYNNTQKFDVHILSPYNDQKLLKILFNSESTFHLPYLEINQ